MVTTLTYLPFKDLVKPKERKIDEEKLTNSRNKFVGTCKVCGSTLTYIGGNVVVCKNEECLGYKHSTLDGDEYYTPVFRVLDDEGEIIAHKLFD